MNFKIKIEISAAKMQTETGKVEEVKEIIYFVKKDRVTAGKTSHKDDVKLKQQKGLQTRTLQNTYLIHVKRVSGSATKLS